MADLLKALHSGRVVLMDGAMGTELLRASADTQHCLEALNVTRPEMVRAVHRAYAEAGAAVAVSNTFQANERHLARHGWQGKVSEIYRQSLALARGIDGMEFVVASVGPLDGGSSRPPFDVASCASADAILVETCSEPRDLERLTATFDRPRQPFRLPWLASFTFRRAPEGRLRTYVGHLPERCAQRASLVGVAALGVNCGTDVRLPDLLEVLAAYRSVTDLPLFVRPNAGAPKQIDRQWVYPETPESMAAWLPELFKAGVVMVGGCCGTTPAHIAAFRQVVDAWNESAGVIA